MGLSERTNTLKIEFVWDGEDNGISSDSWNIVFFESHVGQHFAVHPTFDLESPMVGRWFLARFEVLSFSSNRSTSRQLVDLGVKHPSSRSAVFFNHACDVLEYGQPIVDSDFSHAHW